MHNPWVELPNDPPFVLLQDRNSVAQISKKVATNLSSIPEPFIGDPQTAKVVLLSLNPGDNEEDADAHRRSDLKEAILLNLHRKSQDYPFYPLNPAFKRTPVARWWWKNLHELFDEGKLDQRKVAHQLCVIEWFPYHSKKGKDLPQKPCCDSQRYSFELARNALESHKLVVGMRAKPRWTQVDPRFANVTYLNSWQNSAISPGNAKNFDEIVKALR